MPIRPARSPAAGRHRRPGMLRGRGPAVLLALVALTFPARATQVLYLELPELVRRADRIVLAEVVDIRTGTVEAGGARLPTVTYRLRVEDRLKGSFRTAGKDPRSIELTMLGTVKPPRPRADGVERVTNLPRLPTLAAGERYLLMTTRPSQLGLCAPVGLEQGVFHVVRERDGEVAVNGFGARVAYPEIRARIRAAVTRSRAR